MGVIHVFAKFRRGRADSLGRVRLENALFVFVTFVCMTGILKATSFAKASLDYYYVRNSIEVWYVKGQVGNKEEFFQVRDAIKNARMRHFSQPLYMHILGQVNEWGVVSGNLDNSYLIASKYSYLQATKHRPTWPVTWASLAMIKWRLGEFDDEMEDYLNKAAYFGPASPEVHRLYIELGISLYNDNSLFFAKISEEVKHRLLLGLKDPTTREGVLNFLKHGESLDTACRWIPFKEEYVFTNVLNCLEA